MRCFTDMRMELSSDQTSNHWQCPEAGSSPFPSLSGTEPQHVLFATTLSGLEKPCKCGRTVCGSGTGPCGIGTGGCRDVVEEVRGNRWSPASPQPLKAQSCLPGKWAATQHRPFCSASAPGGWTRCTDFPSCCSSCPTDSVSMSVAQEGRPFGQGGLGHLTFLVFCTWESRPSSVL